MLKIILLGLLLINSLEAKTLYLDRYDKGQIFLKDGFISSLTFESDIKTVFLGDNENFKVELSGDKRILAIWHTGESASTNLLVVTDKVQFNFNIKAGNSGDQFYFIKSKQPVSGREIIQKSLIKDRDLIEGFSGYEKSSDFALKFHDRENFKDTLYTNIRLKVVYVGKDPIRILQNEIVLSQNGKIMPLFFKNFDPDKKIITITGETREKNQKIRVQVAFEKGGRKCVSEIYI